MFWQFGKLQTSCMCNSSVKHVFLWPSQHTCEDGGSLAIIFQPGNTPMPRCVVPSKKCLYTIPETALQADDSGLCLFSENCNPRAATENFCCMLSVSPELFVT